MRRVQRPISFLCGGGVGVSRGAVEGGVSVGSLVVGVEACRLRRVKKRRRERAETEVAVRK